MRKKSDLPSKLCARYGRPFAWRKKWEKVWPDVRYCSERCRRQRAANVIRAANRPPEEPR